MIYIEIKFKNGSKIENIESEDGKRSYPTIIKFGEWEAIVPENHYEIDRNRILYYQKHPEELLELMGHDLNLYWYQKLWIKFLTKIGR